MKVLIRPPGHNSRKRVRVTLGIARKVRGFAAGTALVPAEDGLRLGVRCGTYKAFQVAGRCLAEAGVRRPLLDFEPGLEYSQADLLDFITGFTDLHADVNVRANLPRKQLGLLAEQAALLCHYRLLADLPARVATPKSLAESLIASLERACRSSGAGRLRVHCLVRGSRKFACCRGLAAVGWASRHAPLLAIIDYLPEEGADGRPELALVGKGITFDSGGYDLKSHQGMATMRTDKCGAVYLSGALDFAIRSGLGRRVRLYLCLSENLVGSRAMLPGDIIEYADGTRVEVTNTDAEGRLVMADALLHASRARIGKVISAATLTGAAKVALGRDMCAVFTRDNKLHPDLTRAFADHHEDFWLMPLRPYHKKMLLSHRADLVNAPSGDGIPGASTAAAFLDHFVRRKAHYIHLDLANAYCVSAGPCYAPGPTGAGIMALSQFIGKV